MKKTLLCLFLLILRASAAWAAGPVDIRFITYNVCGLPDVITNSRHLGTAAYRFPLIGEQLSRFDIIALQEVFVPERYQLEKKLRIFFIARGTDSGIPISPGSGIYLFSKWSVPKSSFEKWNDMRGYDAMSHKGFVAARVIVNDELQLDVYNLHAQAGGSPDYRISNYDQMLREIKENAADSKRPFIVLGDFNCHIGRADCDHLISAGALSQVPNDGNGVDHIFFNDNNSGWKISVVSSARFPGHDAKGRDLSDHEGFEAVLRFEKKPKL